MSYPVLYCVFIENIDGTKRCIGHFDNLESAEQYPGPRGYECHTKYIMEYHPKFVSINMCIKEGILNENV